MEGAARETASIFANASPTSLNDSKLKKGKVEREKLEGDEKVDESGERLSALLCVGDCVCVTATLRRVRARVVLEVLYCLLKNRSTKARHYLKVCRLVTVVWMELVIRFVRC